MIQTESPTADRSPVSTVRKAKPKQRKFIRLIPNYSNDFNFKQNLIFRCANIASNLVAISSSLTGDCGNWQPCRRTSNLLVNGCGALEGRTAERYKVLERSLVRRAAL
eukprot:s1765_g2.t1